MAIEVKCPACGKVIKFADTAEGKKGACPHCNTFLVVGKVHVPEVAHAEPAWNPDDVFPIFSGHAGPVTSVFFSAGGSIGVSAGGDATIRLWHLEDGRETVRLQGHSGAVLSAQLSRDGGFAVSGGEDRAVRLWNVGKSKCVAVFEGHEGAVTSVAFHPLGGFVFSASVDRTIRKWELASGKCVGVYKGHDSGITAMAVDPEGRYLLSASLDRTLRVWRTDKPKRAGKLKGHGGPVRAVALSRDGGLAISGADDRTAIIWSVAHQKMLEILKGHTAPVYSVAFNHDSTAAATGGADWALRIWNVDTAKSTFVLEAGQESVNAVAFEPHGWEILAGYSGGSVRLWNGYKGTAIRTLGGTEHSVDTRCPSCGRVFSIPPDLAGREGRCFFCRVRFTAASYSPEKSQAALARGQREMAGGDLQRALAEFDEAVRCQGDNHEAILNDIVCRNSLAAKLVGTDQFREAVVVLDRAVRLFASDKTWPIETHQTAKEEAYKAAFVAGKILRYNLDDGARAVGYLKYAQKLCDTIDVQDMLAHMNLSGGAPEMGAPERT